MELEQYWLVIRKWWWLAVACVIIAGASSYLGTREMPRIYQATTTVMVGQSMEQANPSTQDIWTSEILAQSYADMVQRMPIRQGAAEALGLQFIPPAGSISARNVPGTQLIEIGVRDTDPERARALADEIAQQLILQTPSESPDMQERRAFIQQQLADLETKIEQAQDEIEEEQERLDSANSARAIQQYQSNIYALQQRLASYQNTYATLLVNAQGGPNYISVVEPALTPGAPISPRVTDTVLLASAIGLALAVGGAFLIEFIDDTIKTPDDVERSTGLPTLGTIARIDGDKYPEKLVTVHRPLSPIAEAYRILRTNIQFSSVDKPLRSLLVTSPGPTEGKSITLANLGVVMAQSGLKVVIVDTDLRRAVQHKIFGRPNNHGLCDMILQSNPKGANLLQKTDVDNLYLLSSGTIPPNPAELLASERMTKIVELLRQQFDLVLFDSPPVLVVTDAAVLASKVDGVLLVSDSGKTRRRMARQTVDELQRARANLLGVVLNQLPIYGRGRHYGYYYYNYYYYYASDNDHDGDGIKPHGLRRFIPFLRSSNGHGAQQKRRRQEPPTLPEPVEAGKEQEPEIS